MLALLVRLVDLTVGILGLLLVLRVVLTWFNVSSQNAIVRLVLTLTDPLLGPARRFLGGTPYRYAGGGTIAFDMAALLTLLLLWMGRSVFLWLLGFVQAVILFTLHPTGNLLTFTVMLIDLALELYTFALLIRILFEWLRVPYTHPVMSFLWRVTEPLLAPVRRLVPPFGGLDFSPLIVYILLYLLRQIFVAFLYMIFGG